MSIRVLNSGGKYGGWILYGPDISFGMVKQGTGGVDLPKPKTGRKASAKAASAAIPVDQIINHCLVWYGSGTGGVPTRLDAINDLVDFFKGFFLGALDDDPDRWSDKKHKYTLERLFVLRCSEAIGRLAAQIAISKGEVSIAVEHTQAAQQAVVAAYTRPRGYWCSAI